MAEIIKVSTDEMRDTVAQFTAAQSELQEAYSSMDRAIRVLDTCWKGVAYMAMRTQWGLAYKNIEAANERIQDAIDELNKSADLFDANETGLTSSFQSMKTGDEKESSRFIDSSVVHILPYNTVVYGPPTIDIPSPFDAVVNPAMNISELVYGPPKIDFSPFGD